MLDARPHAIATLWRLVWNDDSLSCVIYRNTAGDMQVRLESPTAVIMSERFEIQPRMVARTQALRAALKRRGWQEA